MRPSGRSRDGRGNRPQITRRALWMPGLIPGELSVLLTARQRAGATKDSVAPGSLPNSSAYKGNQPVPASGSALYDRGRSGPRRPREPAVEAAALPDSMGEDRPN